MEVQILTVFLAEKEKPEGVELRNVGTGRPRWQQIVVLYQLPGGQGIKFNYLVNPKQTLLTPEQEQEQKHLHLSFFIHDEMFKEFRVVLMIL